MHVLLIQLMDSQSVNNANWLRPIVPQQFGNSWRGEGEGRWIWCVHYAVHVSFLRVGGLTGIEFMYSYSNIDLLRAYVYVCDRSLDRILLDYRVSK